MIAQIQGLQYFIANQLSDVVQWQSHVRTDDDKYPRSGDGKVQYSGDQAHILITTPYNRYRMSIISAYLEPPPGAPVACKSLGTVTFHDLADGKRIVGPKADLTWTDISKHIHVRELTDALAAARRELAEGTGSAGRLIDLGERAKKWGIAVKVPEDVVKLPYPGYPDAPAPPSAPERFVSPGNVNQIPTVDVTSPASRDAPWLGAPIIFVTNPGEQIGGMQEIVGWCVKVYSHDRISVFMTPDHSEPSYRDNLPRRGSPAGNGRVHQFNCWDFNPEALRQASRIRHLEEAIEKMAEEGNRDREEMAQLAARVAALDDPLGPPKRRGRPPKVDDTDKSPEASPAVPEKPEGSEAA